jgi:2-aminophenol/2-amino-5-chlorophenol 1,6-dioxygenase alpha subunit
VAEGAFVLGLVVPGRPHPLLQPQGHPGWARLRDAFGAAHRRIAEKRADLLVVFSTQWVSIVGHQVQADPEPAWTLVDHDFHDLGSMPYRFRGDADFASRIVSAMHRRGLAARGVHYRGFPVDTGTVVALGLLDPERTLPAVVVSCNMYSDRGETVIVGKSVADAVRDSGRRAVAVAVTALSNRLHTRDIPWAEDHIASQKDDEWNRKLLEVLGEGRLEDTSQLQRDFARQAHGDSKGKAFWWLAATMGQHNRYRGEVLAYEALWGSGGAVVTLDPDATLGVSREYDEDDVEVHRGEMAVVGASAPSGASDSPTAPQPGTDVVITRQAARPVGAYAHARRVGQLLFLAGVGPRQPGTDLIPGGPVRDARGNPLPYDAEAQCRATLTNVRAILEAAGSSLAQVVDVTIFLIDMERDFATVNRHWAEEMGRFQATRTTLQIDALPTPIAVEWKVVATV